MENERILDVFPAAAESGRLVIAVTAANRFELRQESFSSDVGWFAQSRVTIEPEQLAGLKAALTMSGAPMLSHTALGNTALSTTAPNQTTTVNRRGAGGQSRSLPLGGADGAASTAPRLRIAAAG